MPSDPRRHRAGNAWAPGRARPPGLADVEPDALRERQLRGVVDRRRLAAHVRLPRVGARLPAAARLLLAAERAADLRAGRPDVDVRDAAVRADRGQELLRLAQ